MHFWSQALDNSGPAEVAEVCDNSLLFDVDAGAIASSVVRLTLHHRKKVYHPAVSGVTKGSRAVIQVAPRQLDSAGRVSRVNCVIDFRKDNLDEFLPNLIEFGKKYGRTFDDETLQQAKKALREIYAQSNRAYVFRVALITLVFVLFVWVLIFR